MKNDGFINRFNANIILQINLTIAEANSIMRKNFLIPVFIIFIITDYISAQNSGGESWTVSVFLSPSLVSPKSDWSFSHPSYHETGGVHYEIIAGTFEQNFAVSGGLEMEKGYFGLQGNFEYMPQKLSKSEAAQNDELKLLMGEFSLLLYPLKDYKSFKPFLSLGGGLLKASGDIDNTGLVMSYATGVKIPLSGKFGINLELKGRLLKYTQLELSESISKDIRIHPWKLSLGAFYQI